MSRPASLKGFTLIELLIVIVIIGILSAGAVALFNGTQAKARDAKRKGDLSAMSTAVQVYSTNKDGNVTAITDAATFASEVVAGGYLQKAPAAPQANEKYCFYKNSADATQFAIATKLEDAGAGAPGAYSVGNSITPAALAATDFVTTCPSAGGTWGGFII